MDKISFTIFTPDGKKFHWTPDWIIFILWVVLFAFYYFPSPGDSKSYVLAAVFITTIYFLIASFFTYASLKGVLDGKIVFEKDYIAVNDKVFDLKSINNIDFQFSDFYGQQATRGYQSVNPLLSQGVNNYVTFTDNLNLTQTVYFQLMGEHSYLSLCSFINEAIKAKKMTYNRGVELVGIENISIN